MSRWAVSAFLAALVVSYPARAQPQCIHRVIVRPTGTITSDDPVSLQINIGTPTLPAELTQPTEVTIIDNGIFVDLFADGGPFDSSDYMVETVDLGALPPGDYVFQVVQAEAMSCGAQTFSGSFCVQSQSCNDDSCRCPVFVPRYTIRQLGTFGGYYSWGNAINDLGQVVGRADSPQGSNRPFLWSSGEMIDLGNLRPEDTYTSTKDVNIHGQVVGYTQTAGFIWSDGEMIDLGSLPGAMSPYTRAYAINDAGQAVGYSRVEGGEHHAFLWENGVMTDLSEMYGLASGAARDINESGRVLERSRLLNVDGTVTPLPTLGGDIVAALALNDMGQVVGYSERYPDDGYFHAFLWDDGEMIDLGALGGFLSSKAWAINNAGQLVGSPSYLYDPQEGVMELRDLLPVDSGWTYLVPNDINNAGQITGYGEYGSWDEMPYVQVRAFIMTPGPERPHVPKNRYISFTHNAGADAFAYQVTLAAGLEFPASVGQSWWIDAPDDNGVSRLVNAPVFHDWSIDARPIHIGDCKIVPAATYVIRSTRDGTTFRSVQTVATIHKPGDRYYGDVAGEGTGDLPPLPGFTPPNGVVNVSDIQAYILTSQGPPSPSTDVMWVDLHGNGAGSPPNFMLNVSDLQRIKFGFEGQRYADAPDHLSPGDCP